MNSVVVNVINYVHAFPAITCQNVYCKNAYALQLMDREVLLAHSSSEFDLQHAKKLCSHSTVVPFFFSNNRLIKMGTKCISVEGW